MKLANFRTPAENAYRILGLTPVRPGISDDK